MTERSVNPVPQRSKRMSEHYAADNGYCSCGVMCETGTRFKQHLQEVRQGGKWGHSVQVDGLKPCPFCGTAAICQGRLADNSTEQQWRILCGNPFCNLECATHPCASRKDAEYFWQTRA